MAKKHRTKQKGGNLAEKLLIVLLLIGALWLIGKIAYEKLCASWMQWGQNELGSVLGSKQAEEKKMICDFLGAIPGYK